MLGNLKARDIAWAAMFLMAAAALQAQAGGALGWATAAQVVADDGVAAGSVLTVVGIVATGAVLWFGLTSLLSITLPMTLGGVIMATADTVASALFGSSGGGASVLGYIPPGVF